MLRPLLLSLAARAKSEGTVDLAVRYNPFLRKRVEHALTHAHSDATLEALLQRTLQAALRTPYGRGRSFDLSDWPLLTKEQIFAAPQDFIAARARLKIPAASSGTSGVPLKLWRSLESVVAEQMFLDGLLAPHGLSMRSRVAVLRADSVKPPGETQPPYGRLSHNDRRLTLSSQHLNAETLRWYMDALLAFAPSILWVYPSAAANLYTLMQRAGLALKIPVILASSETLSDSLHLALERFFGGKVINYYGQAERVCLVHAVRHGEFYFHPAYGHVELLNPAPSGNGGEYAVRIVATGYWNSAMPLIRYDTGDLLYIPSEYGEEELREIARGHRPFSGLGGRDSEYVLTRDGMRIIGLNHIPREVKHVAQVQLVQTGYDALTVRVLTLPGFSNEDEKRLLEQARAKVPADLTVSVEAVPSLATTTRGKTPFVIRMMDT